MKCDREGVTVVGSRFGTSGAVAEGEGENQQCKQPTIIMRELSAKGEDLPKIPYVLYTRDEDRIRTKALRRVDI